MTDAPTWSVVIPYYNEARFLPATLRSLMQQELAPFRLILVDNGSDDGSPDICRELTRGVDGVEPVFVSEERKGQVHALETGIAQVATKFVAICDADTVYPPHYLKLADGLFRASGEDVVAVMGLGVDADPDSLAGRIQRAKGVVMGSLLAKQCHSGGYAHAYRTAVLKKAGGYAKSLWPYVLKDHELMHRVMKLGRSRYDFDLWCRPSPRRADRSAVRWTLSERILYHVTPFALKDWFFYRFLSSRLRARNMDEISLRQRSWDDAP